MHVTTPVKVSPLSDLGFCPRCKVRRDADNGSERRTHYGLLVECEWCAVRWLLDVPERYR